MVMVDQPSAADPAVVSGPCRVARAAFRRAWQNFLPTLTERDLRDAYDNHQATARRVYRQSP